MSISKRARVDTKDSAAKHAAARAPGKDDVHEQREDEQRAEGIIEAPGGVDRPAPARPTTSSRPADAHSDRSKRRSTK
ncbi:MAG: hypothetical protein BGO98_18790 [Myxococcales bacterium 68-20]|nr:MAG: hypothetical protein BGO98_18790 [Myxococcales bacterium 68-20]